jgi:hypothetical protein
MCANHDFFIIAVQARLRNAGIEVVGNLPEQFSAIMKVDMVRWRKVIGEAGIRSA